jgi:hypothetical protein
MDKLLSKSSKLLSLPKIDFLVFLLVLFTSLAGHLGGEHILAGDGLGLFDGVLYGNIAKDFYGVIFLQQIDSYRIQRILPSAVIHFLLRFFSIEPSTPNVIRAFEYLDTVLVSLSCITWFLISKKTNISQTGRFFGYIVLFLSFALTKWVTYYPVLTDISAFSISMGLLYFYLGSNTTGLWFLSVLGAFTWPTLLYQGIVFLLFPKRNLSLGMNNGGVPHHTRILIALVGSFALFAGILWALVFPPRFPVPPIALLLPLSILITILFWGVGLANLLNCNKLFQIRNWASYLNLRKGLEVAVGLSLIWFIYSWLPSTPRDHSFALKNILISSVADPGKFLIVHTFVYGPVVFLTVRWWNKISAIAIQHGEGIIISTVMALFFLLGSESRQSITFFPLVVWLTAQCADSFNWSLKSSIGFGFFSLVFSQVWVSFNSEPMPITLLRSTTLGWLLKNINLQTSPNLMYWLNQGPWVDHQEYFVQVCLVILSGVLFYLWVKPEPKITNSMLPPSADEHS